MEYLLVMTISGGTMTAGGLILRCLFKDKISARYYYLLAKAAALYYLVPLPFLKRWYREAIEAVAPEIKVKPAWVELKQMPLTWANYVVRADDKTYMNTYTEIQTSVVVVWLSVVCLLMAERLVSYVRKVHLIAGYIDTKMTREQESFLDGIKNQYGVRRRVLLYQGEEGAPSVTFGIHRPVILCGRETGSPEAKLLVCHEMVHIRRLDAFWKMLVQFVRILHWWNPLAWVLFDEFDRVCEISCDEVVTQGKTKEEINNYARLLIEEAQEKEEPGLSLRWKAGFGSNLKRVKERVNNLMRNKKWNRFAAGTLVAALIFANSMTVFAYRDEYNEIASENMPQEELDRALASDSVFFALEGTEEEAQQELEVSEVLGEDVILYDRQFTDEEGNIYPVPEIAPQWGCDHDYVSGTELRHNKKSDGGCIVTQYKAERCTKCGTTKIGDLISTTTFVVCPH